MQTLTPRNKNVAAETHATEPTRMIVCAEEVREVMRQLRVVADDSRLFVVAWAPRDPAETSLVDLLAALPEKAAAVLTGADGALPVWKWMTIGDLRALAAKFGNRWVVIEPDPRNAIVGVMQQLGDNDSLLIIHPETVSAPDVERWIEAGDEYRGLSHAWDE